MHVEIYRVTDQRSNRDERIVYRYLGYYDGEPVATGQLVYEDGVAGLYNICTVAGFRRKGVGPAFTCLSMNQV